MAHENIPIAFSFRSERLVWKAYSYTRGEPAPVRKSGLMDLPIVPISTPKSLFGILTLPLKTEGSDMPATPFEFSYPSI